MIRTLLQILPAGSRRGVVTHLALTVLSVGLRAVGAVLLVPIIRALFDATAGSAWPWVGLLAAVTVLGWLVDYGVTHVAFRLGFGLLETGQQTVADRVARIRLTWFTATNTATTRQAIAATGPDLVGLIVYLVSPLLSAVLLPLAIAIALIPIAWPLALAALAGVPILLGAHALTSRIRRSSDRAAEHANVELTERVIEFGRTQAALRAARRVSPARSEVGTALKRQHAATMRLVLMQIPGQVIFSLASQVALVLLAGMTVALTLRGSLGVPEAIALIVVIVRYLEPFTVLAELSGGTETTLTALRRIRTVLAAPLDSAGEKSLALSHAPRIDMRNIRFSYDDQHRVLDGLEVTFAPGTTTAIVGPSGSGKTSILSLIAGLHEPTAGEVLIDGVPLSELTEATRESLVSVVFQDPYLFGDSIRANVLAGRPGATPDDLSDVAHLARLQSVLDRSPAGWDTAVGEAGSTISGGERQRVAIARALIKPAPVLLVDEATSALDTENEAAVSAALMDDRIARTRIIVAHRLTSIRAADRVLLVEDGRIIEDGTVDDLLAAQGRFATFWHHQHAARDWQISTES